MKLAIFLLNLLFSTISSTSYYQKNSIYSLNIEKAEKYAMQKEYLKAARAYSNAFKNNNNLGRTDHRYQAARNWAMAHEPDSAFTNLKKAIKIGYSINSYIVNNDEYFKYLHHDKRWEEIIFQLKESKKKFAPKLNDSLAAILDSVYDSDSKFRKKLSEVENKFGFQSVEVEEYNQQIIKQDSINLKKVQSIIDEFGWLDKEIIGMKGNMALILVIQHSNFQIQKKYIPIIQEAVKEGKVSASSLALLEDRIALRDGRKQIYGSQIGRNLKSGKYFVYPLEDPKNVDERRAKVMLAPMSEYLKKWGIDWSLEQYNKDLLENKN